MVTNLEVPVNQRIDLEILIIISPRIKKSFSNFDPTEIGDELDEGEDWNMDNRRVKVKGFVLADAYSDLFKQTQLVAFFRLQKLMAKQICEQVCVDSQCDHLRVGWNKF